MAKYTIDLRITFSNPRKNDISEFAKPHKRLVAGELCKLSIVAIHAVSSKSCIWGDQVASSISFEKEAAV
jgi:hypothetical protein